MTTAYRIGQVCELTGLSQDTLRYYERIKLVPKVARHASGVRLYGDKEVSRLRFIRRAQKMGFALSQIAALLEMRDNPLTARRPVRELAEQRLADVEHHLGELELLRNELKLLLNLCKGGDGHCAILDGLEGEAPEPAHSDRAG